MTKDLIATIANLALALSVIVAVVFGIAQVRAARRDRRERLTLETLRNFQSREFAELIRYIMYNDLPTTREEVYALPVDEQVVFIQFAQEMESLGLLVAERLIDIDLVDKTLGSLVTSGWDKYKVVMLDIRENQPDPFLGEYFQWLAEGIDDRLRINPRTPFHETNSRAANTRHR
jgi:hypothetical protein